MANFYGTDIDDGEAGNYENYYGGDGNDILKGVAAANELYGGADNDVLTGGPVLYLMEGHLLGDGSVNNPFTFGGLSASGDDIIDGGSGRDAVYGFDGDDVIHGGEGDDSGLVALTQLNVDPIYYVAGLFGGDGDDTIYGGGGDDEITGGLGKDDMFGGKGGDTFLFAATEEIGKGSTSDRIGDFSHKEGDIIDLSAIDAKENKGGNQKFEYIGDDKFTKAGQVSYKNGKLKLNTDKDTKAEAILLVDAKKLVDDDFVL